MDFKGFASHTNILGSSQTRPSHSSVPWTEKHFCSTHRGAMRVGGFKHLMICVKCSRSMLALHLMPRSRWNRVDPNAVLLQLAKEMESQRVHQDHTNHRAEPKTRSTKVSFFGQYPSLSISIYPCCLQSIFSSLPLTFSLLRFFIPICSFIMSSILSQSRHTTDLSVSFFLHFSASPFLLV